MPSVFDCSKAAMDIRQFMHGANQCVTVNGGQFGTSCRGIAKQLGKYLQFFFLYRHDSTRMAAQVPVSSFIFNSRDRAGLVRLKAFIYSLRVKGHF